MDGKHINLLFVYSSVEIIPDKLWNIKDVRKFVDRFFKKNRYQILLDINYFYKWMHKLKDWEKRGRPDILHYCLLNSLESIANKEGLLRVWIHTINGEIIEVNPEVRIPKNYERFKGLMADLLYNKRVPKNSTKWLLRIREDLDLYSLLDKYDNIVLLSEKGVLKRPKDIISNEISSNTIFLIGAFPHGDFPNDLYERVDKVYSIYNKPLASWVVTYKIISAFEDLVLNHN